MPRGQGYRTTRVSLGGSRGVVISHQRRRKRSPFDEGEGRPHYPTGVQHISNAQLPIQRQFEDQMRRADLQGV
jgi:hypothetical protein